MTDQKIGCLIALAVLAAIFVLTLALVVQVALS